MSVTKSAKRELPRVSCSITKLLKLAVNDSGSGYTHPNSCSCTLADDGKTLTCWVREARAYIEREEVPPLERYTVPSRTRPGLNHTVEYLGRNRYRCGCEGHTFAPKRDCDHIERVRFNRV